MYHPAGWSEESVEFPQTPGQREVHAAASLTDLARRMIARRKRSAILLALTGQLLADVRELLDRAAEEIARQKRTADRSNTTDLSKRMMKPPPRIRKAGRRRR